MLPCPYGGLIDLPSSKEHKCKEVDSGPTHYFVGTMKDLTLPFILLS